MLTKPHRLTERISPKGIVRPVWRDQSIPCGRLEQCARCVGNHSCDFGIIIARLADYEDSRLTPEEVLKAKAAITKKRSK